MPAIGEEHRSQEDAVVPGISCRYLSTLLLVKSTRGTLNRPYVSASQVGELDEPFLRDATIN